MSENKSNPILESLLLALAIHAVILAVIYFSEELLRANSPDISKAPVEMQFIELTEELLQIDEEPDSEIESILDKYKNVTAKASDVKSSEVTNYFNKSKIDAQVLAELKNMEKAEFEKLKKEGVIPDDLNQNDIKPDDNSDNDGKEDSSDNQDTKEGESYAGAITEFDFSRDPDFRKTPSYRCYEFGKIVVEINVDRNGNVVSAKAISGDLGKECLLSESEAYARRWKFAAKFNAPKTEKGTITFTFFPQ